METYVSAIADVEALYRRYHPIIRSKCARSLPMSAAEDVAQETFVRLWQQRSQLRDPAAAVGWIYRTATRLTIDCLRRHQRRSELLGETVPAEDSPAPADVDPETLRALQDVAQTLGPRELEVIILCRVDGLTQPECAATLSCGERTVRRLLARADAQLHNLSEALAERLGAPSASPAGPRGV